MERKASLSVPKTKTIVDNEKAITRSSRLTSAEAQKLIVSGRRRRFRSTHASSIVFIGIAADDSAVGAVLS